MTQERIAVGGRGRMQIGTAFEMDVANELRARRGLRIDPFGQALLSPDVREVLKTTDSLLRWLPDLVGWRPSRPRPFLIDAKSALGKTENHSIEMRVLLAAQFTDLPVFFVCDDYRVLPAGDVWPAGIRRACCDGCLAKALADPLGRQLPRRCPEHLRKGGRGSGTPYVLVERVRCRPMEKFFGYRRCGTCDVTEDRWDPLHPLFTSGSTQCPDCSQLDAKGERKAGWRRFDQKPRGGDWP